MNLNNSHASMAVMLTTATLTVACLSSCVTAFLPLQVPRHSPSRLFLEDRIAEMIDRELYRQQHHKEFENEWMEKNREAMLHSLDPTGNGINDGPTLPSSMLDDDSLFTTRQYLKDKRMAQSNPQRYCIDRCIATGNCDIFQEMFHMTPQQAVEFCDDCVTSESATECNIPAAFYEDDPEQVALNEIALGSDSQFMP